MSVEVGSAYVTILPSAKGFAGKLQGELGGSLGSAGKDAGDKFGAGMAATAKGHGAAVGKLVGVGLLGALGVAVAGVGAVLKTGFGEAMDASAGTAQLAAGIKSTGNAAGVTVGGLNTLASSIQGYSGQTDDSIVAAEKLLLTFTNIKNDTPDKIFDQATIAASDMAAKMGGDASSNAVLLGKALNDPVKGVSALTRVGVSFTQGQKDSIAAMVKAGDTAGAQKLILGELKTEFGGAGKAAGESLPGQMAKAKRSFEDVSQAVVEGIVPIVAPALADIGSKITTNVLPAVTLFIAGFKDGTGAGGSFRDILTTLGGALQSVGGFLTSHLTLVKAVAIAVGTITAAVVTYNIAQSVMAMWTKAVAVGHGIATAAQWLLNAAMSANPIGIVIIAIAALVAGIIWVATQTTWFQTAWTAVWNAVKAVATAVWTAISSFLSGTWNAIKAAASAVWNAIKAALTAVWNAITTVVTTVFNAYKTIISGVWTAIQTTATTVWNAIKTALSTAWNAITGLIRTVFTGYVTIISGVWTTISNAVPAAWAAVKNAISTAWDAIKTAVSTKAGELVTFVTGLPAKIVSALGNMATLLKTKGQEVLQGLWDGMKAIWDKVTGWVSGIATWIKDHKGPLSLDKKLLTPAGSAIMQGFWDGLKGGFEKVQAGVTAMTGSIAGGASQWVPIIQRVLAELGQPLSLTAAVTRLIMKESGGNPNAINLTDSNAQAGYPSQGLIQTIPQTFAAYAGKYASLGITNPLANIYAGLRYALARYGSISAIDPLNHAGGYAMGTDSAAPGYAWVGERGPEMLRFKGGEQVIPNHRIGGATGGGTLADIVAAVNALGDRFGAELDRQAKTLQTLQRSFAGAR